MNIEVSRADVTVCIPSIIGRKYYLQRALLSVVSQSYRNYSINVRTDTEHIGAIENRNRTIKGVDTEWIAFLDDDDEFLPQHIERLIDCAEGKDADYVYSHFIIQDEHGNEMPDTVLGTFGQKFNPNKPTQTTITTLVRTSLVNEVGGFRSPPAGATVNGQKFGEDYQFTLDCLNAGAKIVHLPEKTWIWRHHFRNTSGDPEVWKEKYGRVRATNG